MINMEKRVWTSSREDAMRAGAITAMTLVRRGFRKAK